MSDRDGDTALGAVPPAAPAAAPGLGVLLTRAPDDDAPLAGILRGRGHRVFALPCVRTAALDDDRALGEAIAALTADDVLVVTSRAGARAIAAALGDRRCGAPVVAFGTATAAALNAHGLSPRILAAATGADLGAVLALPAGTVVLARSDHALGDLPTILRRRGATVRELVAYRTVPAATGDAARIAAALDAGEIDVVVLGSPTAVEALVAALGVASLSRILCVALGPTTARHAAQAGLRARAADAPTARAVANLIGDLVEVIHAARA